jgi:ATP synthase protein I
MSKRVKRAKKLKDDTDLLNDFGLFIQIGLSLALPIIIGVIAGRYLDEKLATGNLLLFTLLIVGIAAGFFITYRTLKNMMPSSPKRRKIQ